MSAVRLRILFVDDEPQMLMLLRLMLESMEEAWDMTFLESSAEALALVEQRSFDVVVSDMRMPGMNGAELLTEVMKRQPRTIRIILSGYADQELVLQTVGTTHQYLSKPFDLTTLQSTLSRIHRLNQRLRCDAIQTLLARMSCLPSVPSVYFRILEVLQSPDSSTQQIGDIVADDPALTAKVLQLVNSAFFGFSRSVSSAYEAVQLLGVGVIRSLALTLHVFAAFDTTQFKQFPVEAIWNHSLLTGVMAQRIAAAEDGDENLQEQAFTAGLLHDVGKLILAANLADAYRGVMERIRSHHLPLIEVERETFGTHHAEVAGYLLGIWALPASLVEGVALHHEPTQTGFDNFTPLTAVHVANALAQETTPSPLDGRPTSLDLAYLAHLDLQHRLPAWRASVEKR